MKFYLRLAVAASALQGVVAPGGFGSVCYGGRITNYREAIVLNAICYRRDGRAVSSQLDLGTCLENVGGLLNVRITFLLKLHLLACLTNILTLGNFSGEESKKTQPPKSSTFQRANAKSGISGFFNEYGCGNCGWAPGAGNVMGCYCLAFANNYRYSEIALKYVLELSDI